MKEKIGEQTMLMRLLRVIYIMAALLPGLDHRFGWSHVPSWLTILSQAAVFAGYAMTLWVMKANSFAASTIQLTLDKM